MAYFDKPELDLSGAKVVAVFTAYNEADRIPYFLSYYRSLGVGHFLAVDNNSNDGTAELLRQQPDVTYFHTAASYAQSNAGRLWTTELADHYLRGKWCLTLDLDEQFVFPYSEYVGLSGLCNYLDHHGYEGVFTVFLDMYSSKALSEAIYTPGQPYLEICDHFEIDGYNLRGAANFPPVSVTGGPRQRLFWAEGKSGAGPSMRKVPLIKWSEGFYYVHSTHSSKPIRIADVTGALLHFKFFSSFKSFAEREVARGDRAQPAHYENYLRLTKEQDLTFMTPKSLRYRDTSTLIETGVMVCPRRFLGEMRASIDFILGTRGGKRLEGRTRNSLNAAELRGALRLRQLPILWPLLIEDQDRRPPPPPPAAEPVGRVTAVRGDRIWGWAHHPAQPGRPVEILAVDGDRFASAVADRPVGPQVAAPDAARTRGFVVDAPTAARDGARTVKVSIAGWREAFCETIELSGPIDIGETGLMGYCDGGTDGVLNGWVWNPAAPSALVEVAVFVDGDLVATALADRPRDDLKAGGVGDGGHGFSVVLPPQLLDGAARTVEVRVARSGVSLRRSPLRLQGGTLTPAEAPSRLARRWRAAVKRARRAAGRG